MCDHWPPYLAFSNRLIKGLPMCYPRLPVGSGLLTRVGVGSSKSSSLVWQAQLCPCLSVTVLCNPRWGQRNVWGGGSRQIMIGQLYILVVSGFYLLVIYDDTLCSYFCPLWSQYLFFLFLLRTIEGLSKLTLSVFCFCHFPSLGVDVWCLPVRYH